MLVTGAAGFVGGALVRRLRARGATVVGVDIRGPFEFADITDPGDVVGLVVRLKPRAIVHAAARVDDRGALSAFVRVNVEGTRNLVHAALSGDVERLVHLSSIVVVGLSPGVAGRMDARGSDGRPLVFDTGSPYFDTKARAEQVVREAMAQDGLPAVIIRPGDVYGLGSQPWVQRPLALMRRRVPLLIDGGRGLIAHTWIDNLVDALVLALGSREALGEVLTITDGSDSTTYGEYFSRLAAAGDAPRPRGRVSRRVALGLVGGVERACSVLRISPPFTRHAIEYVCRRATYPISRARAVLGYEPAVTLDEGMRRLAEQLRRGEPAAMES
ncbi:MAG: NAD(P)-dependent oxidoreductase [Myxococcales bacterium]|nr:NAD(P)-dependent oxidoreductase [Myxococcales bacterium]